MARHTAEGGNAVAVHVAQGQFAAAAVCPGLCGSPGCRTSRKSVPADILQEDR